MSKIVLVYGGAGALGSECICAFKAQCWFVYNVSTCPNDDADVNICVDKDASLADQECCVLNSLKCQLNDCKLDAIICVAGGWIGGNAESKDFGRNTEIAWRENVISSTVAASVATSFLKLGGLLVLTGASAALEPTPSMIGYGMAKVSVHHLVQSLQCPDSGLPTGGVVVGILPVMLDTCDNRRWMPNADTTCWTPLEYISGLFVQWICGQCVPTSGSLLKVNTANCESCIECV